MVSDQAKIDRALSYPFETPGASYVMVGRDVLELVEVSPDALAKSVVLHDGQVGSLGDVYQAMTGRKFVPEPTVPILASGSNASPVRLAEKFSGEKDVVIPVLLGKVNNLCSVYSAHITRYGSVSATLQWAEAATTNVYLLLLPERLLGKMHRSEFVDTNYSYHQLQGVEFTDGASVHIRSPFAYLSLWGSLNLDGTSLRLSAFASEGTAWPALSQGQVMAQVHGLLSPDQAFDAFILSNIVDHDLRKARITHLSRHHADDIDRDRFPRHA